MFQRSSASLNIILIFVCILALMAILSFTPLAPNWGSYEMRNTATITVNGEAKQSTRNQIATFHVGMQAIEIDKETAVNTVNAAMNELIKEVKTLNIDEKDLQTNSVNSYQENEGFREDGRFEVELGDWRAESTLTITLRNVDQAEQLLQILNQSAANSIQGPNFRLDDSAEAETELLKEAVANAREKADKIAAANGQKVRGIFNLYENASYYPMAYDLASSKNMGMGGAEAVIRPEMEVGSSELTKSVTVTFELE